MAHKYDMTELKEYCAVVLGSTISHTNWSDLLLLSDLYSGEFGSFYGIKEEIFLFLRKSRFFFRLKCPEMEFLNDILVQDFWA